ncbi:MAG: sortase, partial [Marmoricola sp.]
MALVRESAGSGWGKNNPLPGLTRNLPKVSRIPDSQRRPSIVVDVSYALTILSVVLFTLLLNIVVISQIQHFSSQHSLYNQLRLSLAEGSTPIGQLDSNGKLVKPGTPIALLKIPELGLNEVVVEGTASRQTKLGVGHRADTPYPGQPGASVLMGRSAAYGGVFRNLDKLRPGQIFTVTTGQGVARYKVIGVRNGDVRLPALTGTAGRLTLVTSKGPAFLPHGVRYVDADLVSPSVGRPKIAFAAGVIPDAQKVLGT